LALLAGLEPLENLAEIVSIGTLIAFIVVSVGVILLRVREPELPRGFKVPGYPITPILSVAACVYILSSLHWYTWVGFMVWLTIALIFYLGWGRRHSALNDSGDDGIAAVIPVEDATTPKSRNIDDAV
jgi:amino acid transporter